MAPAEAYCVLIPPAVQRLVDGLVGKSAGYAEKRRQLGQDPCAADLGAYRLSGPLRPKVCGMWLKNGYRLAFTMQPPLGEDARERVVILYVGRREPRHRQSDVWTLLHDLFGVENPPENHHKPPCCEDGVPLVDDRELRSFEKALGNLRRPAAAPAGLPAQRRRRR
jgi:hypothetical protein